MCAIMGFSSKSIPVETVRRQFAQTISRGPDCTRMIDTGSGYLCFHRLAIMGLTDKGMQPFELDGDYVVCNGELYGFRRMKAALSSKYTFRSDSDCEILLPMYREFGLDMFSMLDAEFALVLYDHKTDSLIAARDPIGIRPLYYGALDDGSLVFASEPKNLVGICRRSSPSRPVTTTPTANSSGTATSPGWTGTVPTIWKPSAHRFTGNWLPPWKNAWTPTPPWAVSCPADWIPVSSVPSPPSSPISPCGPSPSAWTPTPST